MLKKLLVVKKLREDRYRRKIASLIKQIQKINDQKQQLHEQRLAMESHWKQLQKNSGRMNRRVFEQFRAQLNTCFTQLCALGEKRAHLDEEKNNLQQALSQEELNLKKNQISQEKIRLGIPYDDNASE